MQLITPYIKLYNSTKKKYVTEQDVLVTFGVAPNLVPCVQALVGDRGVNYRSCYRDRVLFADILKVTHTATHTTYKKIAKSHNCAHLINRIVII